MEQTDHSVQLRTYSTAVNNHSSEDAVVSMSFHCNDLDPHSVKELMSTPVSNNTLSSESPSSDNLSGILQCGVIGKLTWLLWKLMPPVLCVAYFVYLGFAVLYDPVGAIFLCIIAPVVLFVVINNLLKGRVSRSVGRVFGRVRKGTRPGKRVADWMRRFLTLACCIGVAVFLVVDIWDKKEKWVPLGGLALFVAIVTVFSKHHRQIDYVPVVWGLLLQFGLGILILRWRTGFLAFRWLGDQISALLAYTDRGSEFVFGPKYIDHPVVFKILPVVIFFSAFVSVLYYLGVMQRIIKVIAVFLEVTMRTSPLESFATAAHIFIGQVESTTALKPFLASLTDSELHATMTSGFATVAGTVVAAYVEFGVPVEHVISASFMSAPAALAIAKLSLPETQRSEHKSKDVVVISGHHSNLIEAFSEGATTAIKLIAYVVVNLIAFVVALALLDAVVSYMGARVGHPEVDFQFVCSYVFMPLAVVMGIPWQDARTVGNLIAKKILVNEFLSYADLGAMIKDGTMTGRSAVISTYILCGFGSIAAIGINLGALTSAAPEKRADVARLIVRAMINGNIACFMTACVAGLLYQDVPLTVTSPQSMLNSTVMTAGLTTTPAL